MTRSIAKNRQDVRIASGRPGNAARNTGAVRARKKFLRFFPKGFRDSQYLAWERDYKWHAHQQWNEVLSEPAYQALLARGRYAEIAAHAVRIESRTNLLFSFEKMALRDAVKQPTGARIFATGLFDFLYGSRHPDADHFERWCESVAALPRVQTRVLTWPVVTVFGLIARPDTHIFLKPNVTKIAAAAYGFDFIYRSRPNWQTYASVLAFAAAVRRDVADMKPRDLIDIQSYIWVQGSDEY
jgi:hypothetical protein